MKRHGHSVARDQWTAACSALAVAVLLWTFGARLHAVNPHPGAHARSTITKLWDKHQDAMRAVAAIVPVPSRRQPNTPTRIAVQPTELRLATASFRPAEERRPVTLSPHLAQIRLRAPPVALA
ncbi:hypothetical protein [Occallatibacter riparius]|uniref:Uncharacterized protein n=1 Tax=Occallatibacter riparius TaxID=1002689 RepID=A0A9J7BTU3_9BACT|nr:hypothetical protein [Occallatibacter riparius]UWZ86009.1 hypothetical protein MOP44_08700 [Occallatibacter riparius]